MFTRVATNVNCWFEVNSCANVNHLSLNVLITSVYT